MDDLVRRRRLEGLFSEHAAAVRAYALRRVGPGAADDVVSEVFVVAWRRLDDVPPDPLPWLLGCARRIIANQRRAARRQTALSERLIQERPPQHAFETRADSSLATALETLNADDREVLMLVAWEGLDQGQAAAVIGCSGRAFAMRLHRARRRLASAMVRVDPARPDSMEAMR